MSLADRQLPTPGGWGKAVLGPDIDRHGRPYVPAAVTVAVEHVFDAKDDGIVHLDDTSGGFELGAAELDSLLLGECHRCAAAVDRRRGIELVDAGRLKIPIAVVPPQERTWMEPDSPADALDLGWSVAPICGDCVSRERLGRFDLVMERWREEGRIRR